MKRLNLDVRACCITMLMIVAATSLWTRDAHADAAACKIPQMTKWKVPTDTCIGKLRNRPYEASFAAGEDVICEGWRAVWNTKHHVHELAEGKNATPPTSFAVRHGCDDDGNDVVCVMALRQLGAINVGGTPIASPQPFPTICVRTTEGQNPTVVDACVRGNLDWQLAATPTRPEHLSNISPPDPPPKGNVNCTTCHVKPFIMSTRHFVYTIAGLLTDNGTPDAEGNWRNTSTGGSDAIAAIRRVNMIADRNPTGWKWAEVDGIAWFGKNSGRFLPARRGWMARNCSGGKCHASGFAINNHANWTQDDDGRNIPAMGGAKFMDKNYCEHVVGPTFANPDKPITFDNIRFRGGMRQLMIGEPTLRWPSVDECRDFWKAIGCEPDAAKQTSLVNLCKKSEYPEMFQ
jgi:hypothetical protein